MKTVTTKEYEYDKMGRIVKETVTVVESKDGVHKGHMSLSDIEIAYLQDKDGIPCEGGTIAISSR